MTNANRLVGEDDILLSVADYIKGAVVTIKDIYGTSETGFVTGAFSTVLPGFTVEIKRVRDQEPPVTPNVIVSKYSRGLKDAFYGADEFYWMIGIDINTLTNDSVTGQPDHDLSEAVLWQVDTALRQMFSESSKWFTLYSYTYDGKAKQDNGYINCSDFDCVIGDDPHTINAIVTVAGKIIGH